MAMIYFYEFLVSSKVRYPIHSSCVLDALPVVVDCYFCCGLLTSNSRLAGVTRTVVFPWLLPGYLITSMAIYEDAAGQSKIKPNQMTADGHDHGPSTFPFLLVQCTAFSMYHHVVGSLKLAGSGLLKIDLKSP